MIPEVIRNSSDILKNMDTEDKFAEASAMFWNILAPIFLGLGILGNVLTLMVIRRIGIKKQATLVYLSFLAATDIVVLVTGLPRYWILNVFEYDYITYSNGTCKLYMFTIYLSFQYSSWILVWVTIERLIKTYWPFAYQRYCSNSKAIICMIATLFVLILVNGHFFFTNGVNYFNNHTCSSLNDDFLNFDEYVFVYIDFCAYSIIPFIIISISNIFIIRTLIKSQRNRESMMDTQAYDRSTRVSHKMTKMSLVCTLYFLVSTVPNSIYFIVDSYYMPGYTKKNDTLAVARMNFVKTVTYLLVYSNCLSNFYIYTATNSRFLKELKRLLKCQPSLRELRKHSLKNYTASTRQKTDMSTDINSHFLQHSSFDDVA